MKKVLFTATVVKTHINVFHVPYLKMLKEAGYEVHVAARNDYEKGMCAIPYCDHFEDIVFSRNPFDRRNVQIIKQLRELILREKYDCIHCHTPVAAVLTRIAAANARKKYGVKVLYTAHGFHFYKGAPIKNWLFFYTAEWLCSNLTDCIVTINTEDYLRAKRHFASTKTAVEKINGIGVDMQRFEKTTAEEKAELKKRNGYEGKFLLIYTAEFIARKNHAFLIESAAKLAQTCPNFKILFAGSGKLLEKMKELARQKEVTQYIDFLGFRTDMPDVLKMADVVVSASIEEGLGLNIIEGLATGLPAVASIVRGHKEMVHDGENGYLFDAGSIEDFCEKIFLLYNDAELYRRLSENARLSVQKFSLDISLAQMKEIYNKHLSKTIQ